MPDPTPAFAAVHEMARRQPPTEDVTARLAREQREREQRRASTNARAALDQQVPPRYRPDIQCEPQVDVWVSKFADGGTDSLLLMGPVGTGKTHQAYTALRRAVEARPVQFVAVPVPAFLDGMRPGRDGATFNTVADAGLVLLDDLAAERGSEWTVEVLYRLIDHRWAWQLPTIITTNVGAGGLTEHLGQRITSRLRGMAAVVTVQGDDRRRPPS